MKDDYRFAISRFSTLNRRLLILTTFLPFWVLMTLIHPADCGSRIWSTLWRSAREQWRNKNK